jgi:hypothetical protein
MVFFLFYIAALPIVTIIIVLRLLMLQSIFLDAILVLFIRCIRYL